MIKVLEVLRANCIKGASFYRNCGVVSVGGYSKVIWYYQLS